MPTPTHSQSRSLKPRGALISALMLCFALILWGGAHAQNADDAEQPRWGVTLDWIEQELGEDEVVASEFSRYEIRLGALIDEAERFKTKAVKALESPRLELDALGEKPEEGEPAEASEISAQRKVINDEIAALTQREKQADLIIVRAEQLLERLGTTQGEHLEERLLTHTSEIYTGNFWSKVSGDIVQISSELAKDAQDLFRGQRRNVWSGWMVLALALFASLTAVPCARWLTDNFGRRPQANEPTYSQRTLSAFAEGVASGLLPAAIIGGVGLALVHQKLVGDEALTLVSAVTFSLVFAIVTIAPVRTALVPHAPRWRLLQIDSAVAARLTRRLQWLIVFCATVLAFYKATESSHPYSPEIDILGKLIIAIVVGLLLLSFLYRRFWRTSVSESDDTRKSRLLGITRRILLGVITTAVALGLIGYVELSAFLVTRLAVTILSIAALLLIRRLLHDLLDRLTSAWKAITSIDRESSDGSSLRFWLGGLLDFLLLGPVLLLLGTAWGIPQAAIYLWTRRLLDGVTIGELTFSPGRFLLAILVFTVVFIATRLLRRVIYDRVLPETRMDFGLRHSVFVGIGYVGLALAAILAIVTLGVKLQNLALVFGALSVGIGLGLQGVVSNFMSGLVLLAQRPVRVGDWIEVGGHEGIVRNIMSVSTEIETFDKATIIIPNGDLVSHSLVNWTHTDRTKRVIIGIGVAYGTDIAKVQELLLNCAAKHEEVLATPEPYALFVDFGDSALLFEIRFFVRDAERYHIVSSELRVIVSQACLNAGIEIPFPRLHVNLASESVTSPPTGSAPRPSGDSRSEQASVKRTSDKPVDGADD